MTQIDTAADLDAAFAAPAALLFKNSMTCPISAAARQEMRRLLDARADTPLYVLDVNTHRDLSRDVARRTGIEHDSPQVILLAHGEPRWFATHYAIHAREIATELDAIVESGARL
jgi:bacillithiol system protein YtxJ